MKELIRKIGNFLKKLVSDVYELAEDNAPKAVIAVQRIKEWVETREGTLEELTRKTETTKDDQALELILQHLPKVAHKVMLADGFIKETENEYEAADKLLLILRDSAKQGRVKYWIVLAAEFLLAILNRNFPKYAAVLLTQQAFARIFAKE